MLRFYHIILSTSDLANRNDGMAAIGSKALLKDLDLDFPFFILGFS